MKCPYCEDGVSRYSAPGFHWPCTICEGTGNVLSNEEWLNTLPTEEKAKALYDLYCNTQREFQHSEVEVNFKWFKKWLREIHEEG